MFSRQRAFLGQPVQRLPEQRLCPFAFVNALGTPGVPAQRSCVRLGDRGRVELREDHASAALLRPVVSARMGHEMFERAEQKGTEAPLLGIGSGIGTCFYEGGEKALRQILCIVWI